MSDELPAEVIQRIHTLVYTGVLQSIMLENAKDWTVPMLEYGLRRAKDYSGMEGARAAFEQLLPQARHREEVARGHALMEALRAELVKTQEKIEAGRHITDEATRAEEAEKIATARHAENVRLTRRAIRWAIWATLVGVLGVLFPLLSRWLGQD